MIYSAEIDKLQYLLKDYLRIRLKKVSHPLSLDPALLLLFHEAPARSRKTHVCRRTQVRQKVLRNEVSLPTPQCPQQLSQKL